MKRKSPYSTLYQRLVDEIENTSLHNVQTQVHTSMFT